MPSRRSLLAALASLCLAAFPAFADETMHSGTGGHAMTNGAAAEVQAAAGSIAVSDAWVRATLPGQKAAAGYLTVVNTGAAPDRLLSVSAERFPRVEIHTMTTDGDVMIMRPVEGGLEVPAGGAVQLAPAGGLHLMLLDLSAPLREGDQVELELRFAKAGTVRLALPVRRAGGHGAM